MEECRICGSPAAARPVDLVSNGYPLVRCDRCGTVMIDREPPPGELAATYDRLFTEGEYSCYREEHQQMLRSGAIGGYRYRRGLLLAAERRTRERDLAEIGGGNGQFGLAARQRGWRYVDFDISEKAVDLVRQLGLEAHTFPAGTIPPLGAERFDAVALFEVIEHLWDVRGYLKAIREALRPGGMLLLCTPNYSWPRYERLIRRGDPGSSPPVHMEFFTSSSLARALEAAGYTTVSVRKPRLYRPPLSSSGLKEFASRMVRREEPRTLYALAQKPGPTR